MNVCCSFFNDVYSISTNYVKAARTGYETAGRERNAFKREVIMEWLEAVAKDSEIMPDTVGAGRTTAAQKGEAAAARAEEKKNEDPDHWIKLSHGPDLSDQIQSLSQLEAPSPDELNLKQRTGVMLSYPNIRTVYETFCRI